MKPFEAIEEAARTLNLSVRDATPLTRKLHLSSIAHQLFALAWQLRKMDETS